MPILPVLCKGPIWAELPNLIPRRVLFAPPERTQPQISPDGKTLAFLRRSEKGVLNLWIRPLAGTREKVLTHVMRGVDGYTWSMDGKRILFFNRIAGDEARHLYSAELASGAIRDLTPIEGVSAQNLLTARKKPDEVLIALNLRDRRRFDMYRINLDTGALTFDTKDPGDVLSWVADQRLTIRACSAMDPSDASTSIRTRSSASSPWRTIFRATFEESLQDSEAAIIGFNSSGRSLYVVTAKDSDTSRLVRMDPYSGRIREVLTEARGADIDILPSAIGNDRFAIATDPELDTIQAVGYNYQDLEWKIVDPSCKADYDALSQYRDGDFRILSRDAADRYWLAQFYCPNLPTLYGMLDRKTRKISPLFQENPDVAEYELCPMKPIAIRARDNLKLVGYLTTPLGVEAKGLPLVLIPHGGPWRRNRWEFDPTVQLLANRGYAVLQVNYRGSTGYGLRFLNAGNGEWGRGGMQTDLIDAVNWAIAQGIADPSRVAIMGAGYGGYAALSALTFTPGVFSCAVDLAGPADVATLLDSIPPTSGALRRAWMRRMGLDTNGPAYPRTISPAHFATEIRAPLLIAQGAKDPRTPRSENEAIVEEVTKRGGTASLVVYPEEGRHLTRQENTLDFAGRVEEFLARHLGGRSEGDADKSRRVETAPRP